MKAKIIKIRKLNWLEKITTIYTHELTVDYDGKIVKYKDLIMRHGLLNPDFVIIGVKAHAPEEQIRPEIFIGIELDTQDSINIMSQKVINQLTKS